MGLETPLALLGLFAALLPLLAHRMRQRELPRVVLPTFILLSRAHARKQSKRSFTDTLLLLLRIAIVTAASLAIAAPYVTARLSFGDGRVAATAIVIDDSLSMMRRDGTSSLLGRARARALAALLGLPQGSEVCVVLAGKPARVLVPLGKDLLTATHELEVLPAVSMRGADLDAAVNLAARALTATRLPTRRLLVLSDFARHTGLDPASLALDGVEVTSERMGSAPKLGNAFVENVHAAPDPTQPGHTSVAVELAQTGAALGSARVELVQSGSVVAATDTTFSAGRARAQLLVPTPDDKGDQVALLRVRVDDALDADNQAGVVLTRADAVRLLLVNGDPHPGSDSDELYYAQRALRLVPETTFALATRTIDPLLLAREPLDATDVVLLANVPAPGEAVAQRLLRFVEHGGGLIVAAGDHVDATLYNAALGAVLPSHLSSVSAANDLHFAAPKNPDFLPSGLSGLRETRTQRRLGFDLAPQSLLDFDDGTPAIAAAEIGSGRSLLLATSLDDAFSDLPLRPGFLPLLVAMIHHASAGAGSSMGRVLPGQSAEVPVSPQSAAVEIIDPTGHAQRFDVGSTQRVVRYPATSLLGAYQVRAADRKTPDKLVARGAFVVSAPREESDLTPGPLPASSKRNTTASAGSTHRPLGTLVFLFAGLLVIAEGFARLRKRA
jgi:hypothetical protein